VGFVAASFSIVLDGHPLSGKQPDRPARPLLLPDDLPKSNLGIYRVQGSWGLIALMAVMGQEKRIWVPLDRI